METIDFFALSLDASLFFQIVLYQKFDLAKDLAFFYELDGLYAQVFAWISEFAYQIRILFWKSSG